MKKSLRFILLSFGLSLVLTANVSAQCAAPTSGTAAATTATCTNNGKITVSGVSGGAALDADTTLEYAIESYSGVGPATAKLFQSSNIFTNLYPGNYSIAVRKNCLGAYSSSYLISGIVVGYSYTPMSGSVTVNWGESGCRPGMFTAAVTGGNKAISGTYTYQLVNGITSSLSDTASAKQTNPSFRVAAGNYFVRVFDDCGSYITRSVTMTGGTATTNPYLNTGTFNMQRFTRASCSSFLYNYYRTGSLRFSTHNLSPTGAKTYLFGPDKTAIDSSSLTSTGTVAKDISSYITAANLKVNGGINTYGPFFEKVIDSCGVVYYSDSLYIDTAISVTASLTRVSPRCDTANYTLALTQTGTNYTGVLMSTKAYRVRVSNSVAGLVEYTNDSGATWSTTVTTTNNVLSSRALAQKFGVRICGRVAWASIPSVLTFNPALLAASPWACIGNTGLALNASGNFGNGTFAKTTFQITAAPASYPHPLTMTFTSAGKNAASATDTKSYLSNLPTGTYSYTITNECGQTISGSVVASAGRTISPKLSAVGNCASGIIQLVPTATTIQTGSSAINAAGGSSRLKYSIQNKKTGAFLTTGGSAGVAVALASTGINPSLAVTAINTTDTGWHILTIWPDTALLFTSGYCPVKDSVYVNGVGSALRAKSDFIACKSGGLGTIAASHTGGLPPYKYELKNLTTGAIKAIQYSPLFTGLDITNAYEVRVTDTCGNSSVTTNTFDTVTMNVFLAGTACNGSKTELRANDIPGAAYRWIRNGDTVGYERILPLTNIKYEDSGLYSLVLRPLGCDEQNIATIRFGVNPTPDEPLATATYNYCAGSATSALTATGTAIKWYEDTTADGVATAYTPSATTAGTKIYFVSQTSAAGCESYKKAITVTVNPIPAAPVTVSLKYCQYETAAALTATGTNLKWYSTAASTTALSATPVIATTTPDTLTYFVTQSSAATCESAKSGIGIRINPTVDTPYATSTISYCKGETATALSASGTSLKWYTAASGGMAGTTAPTPATDIAGSHQYYVSQTNSFGCESQRKLITVITNDNPAAPTVTSPVIYCQNAGTVALTAAGSELLWYKSSSEMTGTSSVTPSSMNVGDSTFYVSQKSDKGCTSARAEIKVTVNPTPTAPMVATPVTYCSGNIATALTAAGISLKWYASLSDASFTTSSPTPSTAAAGTTKYYVTQTNTYTCESPKSEISVVVNATPAAPSVVSPIAYCVAKTASALSATGSSLLWYGTSSGGTGSAAAPTPTTSVDGVQNYYVNQTSSLGCPSERALIVVNINPLPAAPTVVSPVNFCNAATATTLAATGINLKWYTAMSGGAGSATAPLPGTTMVGSTSYFVSQTSLLGCEGNRSELKVIINPLPVLTLSPVDKIDFIFCPGYSLLLKATAPTATTYQWNFETTDISGATSDTLRVNANGNYGVTVKNSFGCTTTKKAFVMQDTISAPILSPTDVSMCDGSEIMLFLVPARSGYIYDWMKDGVQMTPITFTETAKTIKEAGTYKVSVTNLYGCNTTTNSSNVHVYPKMAKPTIVVSGTLLKLSKLYPNYQWYRNSVAITGATTPTFTMKFDGTYYAKVSDANGCSAFSDTVVIKSLGIDDVAAQNGMIKIYPNPARNIVHIDAPIDVNVKVTDITGRTIYFAEKAKEVDLGNFADGIYLFLLSDKEGHQIAVERINKSSN